jgi:predicted CXXCH cytochrome family protein
MYFSKCKRRGAALLVFALIFCLSTGAGLLLDSPGEANAAPPVRPPRQEAAYAGSESCAKCHEEIHTQWESSRHANAFSSPIFQRDWHEVSDQVSCLECHTTGYNLQTHEYAEVGVTCESCHGPFQPTHPAEPMPVTPNAELCGTCHQTTTDEWKASVHGQKDIFCQACHNPHSQSPMADTVTELCTNCHKERGESFTHGTHANAGLECSNCHMYTSPRTEDPIMGLVPTGHTFTVGSEACVGCHQDTVHTRDELIKVSGGELNVEEVSVEDLEQVVTDQEQKITSLQAQNNVRLYSGLIQGAIVGLVVGGTAAWVVSRRIEVVEVEDEEEDQDEREEEA